MNNITVINESTVVEVDQDLSAVCRAIDFQVKEHFAPSWLIKRPPAVGTELKDGNSKVLLVDNHAALAAFHDVYDDFLTVVFVKESIDAGVSWTVTLSHEILEAIIDPENIASRAILKKFNFIKEAYYKENFFFEGDFFDSEVYSLLKK